MNIEGGERQSEFQNFIDCRNPQPCLENRYSGKACVDIYGKSGQQSLHRPIRPDSLASE
jgi:hypothetical protein